LLFAATLLMTLQKEAFMGSRPSPQIQCILCSKSVDLQVDLSADENGKAVHENCYVNRLIGTRANQTVAEHLFDTLAIEPLLHRCPKCRSFMLHVDTTFVGQYGKLWKIALPICMNGNDVAGRSEKPVPHELIPEIFQTEYLV
jgi:hypothetical protein